MFALGQRGYLGLPITVNAGWLAMFIFIADSDLLDHLGLSLVEGPLAAVVWTCAVGFALLEVSRFRYGKPTKTPIVFMTCAVFVALLFLKIQFAVASAFAICMGLFFYAAVSPCLPKQEESAGFDLDATGEEEPVTVHHS